MILCSGGGGRHQAVFFFTLILFIQINQANFSVWLRCVSCLQNINRHIQLAELIAARSNEVFDWELSGEIDC